MITNSCDTLHNKLKLIINIEKNIAEIISQNFLLWEDYKCCLETMRMSLQSKES